jgi:hypothetical protein
LPEKLTDEERCVWVGGEIEFVPHRYVYVSMWCGKYVQTHIEGILGNLSRCCSIVLSNYVFQVLILHQNKMLVEQEEGDPG